MKIRIDRRTERSEERPDLLLGAEPAHGDLLGARDADPAELLHERLFLLGERVWARHPAFHDRDDQQVAGIRFVDFIVREILAERRNDGAEQPVVEIVGVQPLYEQASRREVAPGIPVELVVKRPATPLTQDWKVRT